MKIILLILVFFSAYNLIENMLNEDSCQVKNLYVEKPENGFDFWSTNFKLRVK